jgi:hypothetical protein
MLTTTEYYESDIDVYIGKPTRADLLDYGLSADLVDMMK